MAGFEVRDVPESLLARIRRLAEAEKRTVQEEVVVLLERATAGIDQRRGVRAVLDDMRAHRIVPRPGFPDSVQLVREDRDR